MLLRRFTQHIRSQNWLAVSIDLIVIVLGVFIGMQVTEWNQERKDRIEEISYLERILFDISETIIVEQDSITFMKAKIQEAEFVLDTIESGKIASEEIQIFGTYLDSLARTNPLRYTHATINEMIATGKLNLIQDIEIRNTIALLTSWPEQWQDLLEKPSFQIAEFNKIKYGFYINRRDEHGNANIIYDSVEMISNPRVYQVIANMQSTAAIVVTFHTIFLDRYRDAEEQIQSFLSDTARY
ncbi:MAG: hypothetical protein COA96_14245 [SAR86 cluster bacterium]|uniref:Uncharacterized protein n=1 Tax=SAR86 cluster bacterium TaxID=2030880 RepID=A0A2A5AUE6_9GAMM|nr:MAG: hypothetical protein COA96_14245 [SAR86 cluster bacterium]